MEVLTAFISFQTPNLASDFLFRLLHGASSKAGNSKATTTTITKTKAITDPPRLKCCVSTPRLGCNALCKGTNLGCVLCNNAMPLAVMVSQSGFPSRIRSAGTDSSLIVQVCTQQLIH